MNLDYLSLTQRRLLLLIVQIVIIIACVVYIEFIYYRNILPDKTITNNYEATQCSITNSKLVTKGSVLKRYRASFLLTYSVDDKKYNSWATGNGLDSSYTSDRLSQQNILEQFDIGQTYPCWYNPKNPEIAVLVLRHDWSSTFKLFIPAIVLLIVVYYFTRTFLQLFGFTNPKKPKKQK